MPDRQTFVKILFGVQVTDARTRPLTGTGSWENLVFRLFFNVLEKSLKLSNWHNKGWTRQFERENGADKIMTEVPLIRGSGGARWERTHPWDSKQTDVQAIVWTLVQALVKADVRTFVQEILGDISTYRCNIIRVDCCFALSDTYPLIDVVETWMMWPW